MSQELPEIEIKEGAISIAEADELITGILAWFNDPLFPNCNIALDPKKCSMDVVDENGDVVGPSELTCQFRFVTDEREPAWFTTFGAFMALLADNPRGGGKRKITFSATYTRFGYVVSLAVKTPYVSIALIGG